MRVRLALAAAAIKFQKGGYDVAFAKWLRPILKGYQGFYAKDVKLDLFDQVKEWGDEQIDAVLNSGGFRDKDKGIELKKYRAPFLAEKVAHLTLFAPAFQQKALRIGSRLELINEQIDEARFYMQKTFDVDQGETNLAKLRTNAENSYVRIASMSKDAADMIGEFLTLEK